MILQQHHFFLHWRAWGKVGHGLPMGSQEMKHSISNSDQSEALIYQNV